MSAPHIESWASPGEQPSRAKLHQAAHQLIAYALEQIDHEDDLSQVTKSCLVEAVVAFRSGLPSLALVEIADVLNPADDVSPEFRPRGDLSEITLDHIREAFWTSPAELPAD